MFLVDYDTFIRQAIPPHWRDHWQHHLIASLCAPLKELFEHTYEYHYSVLNQLNQNSQVLSFEARLNELNNYKNQEITVGDGNENGTVKVICPNLEPVIASIKAHFQKVKIAGKHLEIIPQN